VIGVQETEADSKALLRKPPPLPEAIEVIEVEEDNVKGLIYRPKDASKRCNVGVVWYHGGGFIFGRPGIHQLLYIRIVKSLGVTVFAPQYRLAPEHPFPAGEFDL
jgi:acetyl esterase/lipase